MILPSLPLHCRASGNGPPIVCLHGFGLSSYTWREIRASMSGSHTVYTLDLKGFGGSPRPRDGRYSVHDQAALVRECLERLHLTGVTLMGHSLGGGIALVTALDLLRSRPGVLRSLVLLDAASYNQPLPPFIRVLRTPIVGPLIQWLVPARTQVRTVLELAYHDASLIPNASVEAYAAPLQAPGGRYALRATARTIVPADITAICTRYPTIDVPTLIVWGAHDAIVPLEHGERLRRAIPRSELIVIDQAGHMPHEETPEPVVRAIVEFLERA